jgi:hypothetical protein
VTSPGKAAADSGIAVVARNPNHADVFWVAPDGSIGSTWWDSGVAGGQWPLDRPFSVTSQGKSAADSSIAVVARDPNHLDLFWEAPDGSVATTWWDSGIAGGLWPLDRPFSISGPGKIAARRKLAAPESPAQHPVLA